MLKRTPLIALSLLSLGMLISIACMPISPQEASPTRLTFALPTPSPVPTVVSISPTIAEQLPSATIPPTNTPESDALEPIESAPSNASTPITARLILSKAPLLNEPVDLTFIFSSVLKAPGTTATIILPDGAVLVEGDLEWTGDLEPNEPHTLHAIIKFVDEGNWTIEAKALHEVGNGDVWGDAAYIYIHVSEEAGHFGFPTQPPPQPSGEEVPSPPPVEPSP